MSSWQHIKAILALPFLVLVIIPLILLLVFRELWVGWNLYFPLSLLPTIVGCTLLAFGLVLMVKTNLLFARRGDGTLAPWNPPKKLVVLGIYRHVRNPMILGVLIILLGEAILFGSLAIFVWFIGFFMGNQFYIIRMEERDLSRRFGEDYIKYTKNVPRWIPRIRPWNELEENLN